MLDNKIPTKDEAQLREIAMRWYGWGSPVGLGILLFLLGGGFALVGLGMKLLASIA